MTGGGRRRRLRLVVDFAVVEMLTASRLGIDLRAFTILVTALHAAGALVVLAAGLVGAWLLRDLSVDDAGVTRLWLVAALLVVGAGAVAVLQERLSRRRFVVARAPNLPLLRAWDVEPRDVLVVYRLIPVTWQFVRLGGALVGVAVVAPPRGLQDALAAAVALSALVSGWALTAARATHNAVSSRGTPMRLVGMVGLPAAVVVGAGLNLQLAGGVGGGGAGPAPGLLALLAAAVLVTTVVAVRSGLRAWRTMADNPFPLAAAGRGPGGLPARGLSLSRPAPLAWPAVPRTAAAVLRHVGSSWQAGLVSGVVIALTLTLVAVLSAVATGARFWRGAGDVAAGGGPLEITPDVVRAGLVYLALAASLVLVELLVSAAGPVRVAGHLRARWELGDDAGALAGGLLLVHLASAVVVGVAVDALAWALTGSPPFAGTAVCVAVVSGALAADATFPPPRNADGTAVTTSATLLLGLVLAAPVTALSLADLPVRGPVAGAATLLLATGAFLCLRHRIVTHPSSSTRSTPDTVTTVSWRGSRRGSSVPA